MVRQLIQKIHVTKLASGESDPGPAAGESLLFTKSRVLPSGRTRVVRGYTDDTVLPDPVSFGLTPMTFASALPAGFPFMLHEDMFANAPHSDAIFAAMQADGGDLRLFYDSGVSDPAPFDLVSLNTATPQLQAWGLSAAGGVNMYLRDGSDSGPLSPPAAGDANGRNAVWGAYQYAAHDPAIDVSGNNTPVVTGATLLPDSGPAGGPARGFGSGYGVDDTDKIDLQHSTIPALLTLEAWVYVGAGSQHRTIIGSANGNFQLRRFSNGWLDCYATFTGGQSYARGGSIPLDTWTFVAATVDLSSPASVPNIYINGSPVTPALSGGASGTPAAGGNWQIGSVNYAPENMVGYIAEPRIRADIRDAAWFAAEYANVNDPAAFAAAGARGVV